MGVTEESVTYVSDPSYVLTNYSSSAFSCPQNDAICEACYDSATRTFFSETGWVLRGSKNLGKIRYGDRAALFFMVFLVGVREADEMHATHMAEAYVSAHIIKENTESRFFSVVFYVTQIVARYCVIPFVNWSFVYRVLINGADAFKVCLQGVAFFFILEVDDLVFGKMAIKLCGNR